ncbi:MAG: 4Fe-4S dicluster domain-containing protein [Pontiella sp.]
MKRKIIEIDEELCNGCGDCIVGCAEGALRLIDGKAKMVKDQFCDGFGDCVGTCPTGALQIIEREAEEFDEEATIEHVRNQGGEKAVKRMLDAAVVHEPNEKESKMDKPKMGGCPGMQVRMAEKKATAAHPETTTVSSGGQVIKSDLEQWPIQLHLVPPTAPFFDGKELVVLSTCAPIASPDVHWRFVRGRSLVVACPKLDRTEGYVEKLAAIMAQNDIPKVIIVRMSVPCCGGLTAITQQAFAASGRTDLVVEEVTIGLDGELLKTEKIAG